MENKSKKKNHKSRFIVIEGGEGSGKTTLIMDLKKEFGDQIIVTREPGGSPYAELIRKTTIKHPLSGSAPAETTLCLMFAARFDNLVNMVQPALRNERDVVSDRLDSSSYAYQVVTQSGGTLKRLFWSLRKKMVVLPDWYVFIDVDPEEGLRRARARNSASKDAGKFDLFDNREVQFHHSVRRGYLEFFSKVPHIKIDANRPLEVVRRDFLKQMRKLLK